MATEPETSSPENPIFTPTESFSHSTETLEQPATPWVDYAIEQARFYQKNIEETLNSALEASTSRLSEIRATSSAHLSQSIDTLEDVKSNYADYKDILFAKIKEGASVAASHPMITGGVAAALGLVVLRGPRCFLYYKSLRFFVSKESLLNRADAKVKELQHSIDVLKAESKILEANASHAEEVMVWGRKKLRTEKNYLIEIPPSFASCSIIAQTVASVRGSTMTPVLQSPTRVRCSRNFICSTVVTTTSWLLMTPSAWEKM